jgi:hypothetical protein
MLGLYFGEALAYALHLAFALQLAFADRQGGGKTDDYTTGGFNINQDAHQRRKQIMAQSRMNLE